MLKQGLERFIKNKTSDNHSGDVKKFTQSDLEKAQEAEKNVITPRSKKTVSERIAEIKKNLMS